MLHQMMMETRAIGGLKKGAYHGSHVHKDKSDVCNEFFYSNLMKNAN